MSFEEDIRSQLHEQVPTIPLPVDGPERAMARSRQRDHRRRAAVAIATVAVLGLGTVGFVQARSGPAGIRVASQGIAGLQDQGPLELSWQRSQGGVASYMGNAGAVSASGALYRLSTAPGSTSRDVGDGNVPTALYRLADDGTWEVVSSDADLPKIKDLGTSGELLYGMSTNPVAGGVGYEAVLSSSADGGASWQPSTTLSIDPPSDVVDWRATANVQVEGLGDRAVALMSMSFHVPDAVIASSLAAQGIETDPTDLQIARVVNRAEGITILRQSTNGSDPSGTPSTVPPGEIVDEAGRLAAGATMINPATEVIGVVPWSDLGLTGPSDLAVRTQLLVRDGDAWNPVDPNQGPLGGLLVYELDTLGSQFVLDGWTMGEGDASTGRTLVSSDGASWHEVSAPFDSQKLLGVGSAWVSLSMQGGNTLQVSQDQGASWQELDLGALDPRLADASAGNAQAGPLGLAIEVRDWESDEGYLVTTRDLVNWTVTPVSELFGPSDGPNSSQFAPSDGPMVITSILVGTDRIVLTGQPMSSGPMGPNDIIDVRTAVGTPTRS